MNKIIFLRNKKYRPSSYYRIFQYISDNSGKYIISEYEADSYYRNKNVILKKFFWGFTVGYYRRIIKILTILFLKKEYMIVVQREIFPKFIDPIGKLLLKRLIVGSKKVYWEFDDNIFINSEITKYERELLMKYSKKIVVGNQFLKEKCVDKEYHNKVEIINTTDKSLIDFDYSKNISNALNIFDKEFRFVWLGTSGNLIYLNDIVVELENLFGKVNKKISLIIVSDKPFEIEVENINIINIPWSRDGAIEAIANSHMGLMPLLDNEFTKGKCSFKAIQYMAMGMPIGISPIGMNINVVDEWKNGIFIDEEFLIKVTRIIQNKGEWYKMAINSRKKWENEYNPCNIRKLIAKNLEI